MGQVLPWIWDSVHGDPRVHIAAGGDLYFHGANVYDKELGWPSGSRHDRLRGRQRGEGEDKFP